MNKEELKEIVKEVIKELRDQRYVSVDEKTPYQKTETLLYNYNKFKELIERKKAEIAEIEEHGVPTASKSITVYGGGSSTQPKTDDERKAEAIYNIDNSIANTEMCVKYIDDALASISGDDYYQIIPMRYFEGKSFDEIAKELTADIATIYRNKSRLINELALVLFSDEVIRRLYS